MACGTKGKHIMANANPPEVVIKDLAAVARNNDIFKEVCPSDENHNNADH